MLVAANGRAGERTCKGVTISINHDGDRIYLEKDDVLKSLERTAKGPLVHRHTRDIDLARLESNLETNPWVRDAELYFDTKDVLHVAVAERVPVARVFTTLGTSFYIDSAGYRLPLLETYSAKLPVVTGFTPAQRLNKMDSALLQDVKRVVQTICADPFWMAQIGQIDITPQRKFELIPVVGSHIVRLGSGSNVSEKLARLLVFYRQVLPKAGLAKYSALDVQFEGQVVAVRRGPVSAVDSLQLQKNIRALLEKKKAEQEPQMAEPATALQPTLSNGDFDLESFGKDSAAAGAKVPPAASTGKPGTVKTTGMAKMPSPPAASEKKAGKPASKPLPASNASKKAAARPKAVMPRLQRNEY